MVPSPASRRVWALAALGAASLACGCTSDSGLSGAPVPNALPDTRLTGLPPNLRQAGFSVQFHWTGSDPDGAVKGYQWKLSDDGLDGISVRDTLTVDPASGAVLNPWRFTTRGDSLFFVGADLPGYPGDDEVAEGTRRSFQTHTLFVRAVDDRGGLDPTPAYVSFTSTTLTPTVAVTQPVGLVGRREWADAPPTVSLAFTGHDPDFALGLPSRVRYLWKEAKYGECAWIASEYDWNRYGHLVIVPDDSAWSEWQPYPLSAQARLVTFANQRETAAGCPGGSDRIGYVFAVQVQDTAGAVTPSLTYGVNLINVRITSAQSPLLTVYGTGLGSRSDTGTLGVWGAHELASDQTVTFSWRADANHYGGIVTAYRYGWDVADIGDPADPGWRVQPGDTPQHFSAPTVSFASGFHALTVEAWDNSGQVTRIRVELNVVPIPDRADQLPLLLVDHVADKTSNAWMAGGIAYDQDERRDQFWLGVLTGGAAVNGFEPLRDIVDLETAGSSLSLGTTARYRSLIWTRKQSFGVTGGFTGISAYQRLVGNVFLCGQQALGANVGASITRALPGGGWRTWDLMTPVIFDTPEFEFFCQNKYYALGFGEAELADGSRVPAGRLLYPYSYWGIAALDQTGSPSMLYPCAGLGQTTRKASCAGLKAVVLDPVFKAQHLDPGAIADTIYTWRTLDYQDYPQRPALPDLAKIYAWNLDEFYDTNITRRPASIVPQVREDGSPMIEPMFRYHARYDWIDDVHAARGAPQWPQGYFTSEDLARLCGSQILGVDGRTKVANAPVGFLTHKMTATKPGGRADVVWGFDPSRFDPTAITRAIRWVLYEQFGLFAARGGQTAP